jgi:hypothetical protein
VFVRAQEKLAVPHGSVKARVGGEGRVGGGVGRSRVVWSGGGTSGGGTSGGGGLGGLQLGGLQLELGLGGAE